MTQRGTGRGILCWAIVVVTFVASVPRGYAAELEISQLPFTLGAEETIDDDLIVIAPIVTIEGTVNGDLVLVGTTVTLSGRVNGDAILLGQQNVVLSGEVSDDARIACSKFRMTGTVEDDLFVAGADLGIGGRIGGALYGGGVQIVLDTAIAEGAMLAAQLELDVSDETTIGGDVVYSAPSEVDMPDGVTGSVDYKARKKPSKTLQIFLVVVDLIRSLIGFALAGWIIMRFAPKLLPQASDALGGSPMRAGATGLIVVALLTFAPLASCLVIGLLSVFWFKAGFAALAIIVGVVLIGWQLSPLVTGLWLGRKLTGGSAKNVTDLRSLLIGALIISALGCIPYAGIFIYAVSFVFAVGGVVLAVKKKAPEAGQQTLPL